ncbi:FG-GAP repeat domain-containing protein [Herbidospora mongoliensis]|uniref:FG-GAP repeat domain-containing protein n=1 Tax=Herbidospora mongoliensis TaxID=688067 RepID=UPI00082E5790|nr:VCBS repeat-containing protein [Herbidospora mongoliensis]
MRLLSGSLGVLTAMAIGLTGLTLTTAPAHADSVAGGQITRSEVLARAQNWVDRGVRYNLTRYSSTLTTDADGAHRYGPDCSGLVSMAWHITANSGKGGNSTDDFASWSGKHFLGSLHDLKPGDAILTDGHMELFARWKDAGDHTKGAWTYSLNGGPDPDGDGWRDDWAKGPTPNSRGKVGDESWSSMTANYRPIRYNNIVDDTVTPSRPLIDPQARRLVDFDGDGKPDFLGLGTSGDDLWFIQNTSTPGALSRGGSTRLSTGWKTVTKYWLTDYDGDGRQDVLGLNGTDQMFVWRNTSSPGAPSLAGYVSLGAAWSTLTKLVIADFTGDGKVDIAGFDAGTADTFWVVPNTSTAGNPSRGNSLQMSSGWKTVTRFWVADYDADGKTDLLGLNGTDQMLAWRNTASGNTPSFAPYADLGSAWSTLTKIVIGDFTGDGKVDLAGFNAGSADAFWVVPNTSTAGNLSRGASFQVSTGWQTVTEFLVADYDKDGKTDLLGLNGTDQMLAWRNSPAGGRPVFAPFTGLGAGWSTIGHIPTAQ